MPANDEKALTAMTQMVVTVQCQQLVMRAAASADAADAQALAALFTDDAVLMRPGADALVGRQAILDAYAARPADRITRHLLTNMQVDVERTDRARVRSNVLLWTGSASDDGSVNGRPARGRQLVGEFDDQLQCDVHGVWRIQRRDARFVLYRET